MILYIRSVFIVIFIFYIVYALRKFIISSNINNEKIMKKNLIKINLRLVLALCIFAFPFILEFYFGSNINNINLENIINIVDNNNIDNSYNDLDNKIVEVVNLENDSKSYNKKNIVYYNQCDSKWQSRGFCSINYSMCGNGCGATSLAMVISTIKNKEVTPLNVRDYLCSNNLHINGGMNYSAFTNTNLFNYYGINGEIIVNYNESRIYDYNKAKKLLDSINNNYGVVLLIPGHYIVIGYNNECSNNQVYMYDPGNQNNNKCYTMEELWDSTWNISNRCYNEKKCGWRMAWRYKEG